MNKNMLKTIFGVILFFTSIKAFAVTLNFDDIGQPNNYIDIPTPYKNFTFNSTLDILDISSSSRWAESGPAVSGSYAVINNLNGDGIITSQKTGGTFSFQSVYVKSWFGNGDGQTMTIKGLLKGNVVGSVSFTQSSTWTNVIGNFDKIDTLVIGNVGNFLIDNLVLNQGATVGVFPQSGILAVDASFDAVITALGKSSTLKSGQFKVMLNQSDITASCAPAQSLLKLDSSASIGQVMRCPSLSTQLLKPGKNRLFATFTDANHNKSSNTADWVVYPSQMLP